MPTPHYGQPRYRAIAAELRDRIENGAIRPGTLLPAESALIAEFRASRGTIRQAIAVLREARFVVTEHGRGSIASLRPHEIGPEKDSEPDAKHRETVADPELATLFGIEAGTVVIERQNVIRRNGAVEKVVRIYRPLQAGT
ncbi:GntR family transcriptional regulator [Micromonospora sp. DT201]|uniref:GntR family transcriptional regulator n=1 Tax=Micromonospora sp. DT201 TaxID=3393442 RepID=UPI003CF62D7D